MSQAKLSYVLFATLIAIFTFHFLGLKFDWYGLFFGYDIPMHMAGGAWLALVAIYVLRFRTGFSAHMSRGIFALITLASVMSGSMLWEIYEYSMDIFKFKLYTFSSIPGYVRLDSFHDLVNDFIGAVIVLIFWLIFSGKANGKK